MADSGFVQSLVLVAAGSALTLFAQVLLGGFSERRAQRLSLRERRSGTHDKAFEIVGAVSHSSMKAEHAVQDFRSGLAGRTVVDDAHARLSEDLSVATKFGWTMYRDAAPMLVADYVEVLERASQVQDELSAGSPNGDWAFDAVASACEAVQGATIAFRNRTRSIAGFHKIGGWDRALRWARWWRTWRSQK